MKDDLELMLQAYADDELPAAKAASVEKLLAEDTAARQRVDELRGFRALLKAHAPEVKLPVTGDFYWSQIERQIKARPVASSQHAFHRFWLRWLFPAGITALLALGLLQLTPAKSNLASADEIETQLDDATFISFRSQTDGFSVVWVDTQAGRGMAAYDEDLYY
jgi:anti-sigma factor RsiW